MFHELVLIKNQLKSELSLQQAILLNYRKEYEIHKFSSNLEMIRYQEGLIDGIQKSIYRIQNFIKENEKWKI